MSIRTIDLSHYFHGTEQQKRRVIEDIDAAFREIGFVIIKGHGVPKKLLASAAREMQSFYDLPLEEKMKIKQPLPGVARGYTPMGTQALSNTYGQAAPADLNENFAMGPVGRPDDPYFANPEAKKYYAPNIWPSRPEKLSSVLTEYHAALGELTKHLMSMCARAMGAPQGFFDDKIDKPVAILRTRYYPGQKEAPLPGQLRAAAHTDFGTLTLILTEDKPGGLQVFDRNKQWIDVPAGGEGCFIVNAGDMLQRWTNNRWRASIHRVVNPPREVAETSGRLSLVFFHHPNYDVVIDPRDFCGPEEKPLHEPVVAGEYWAEKLAQSRKAA